MGFDFDDLEDEDPSGLPDTTAMSDEDFEGFKARIAKAEKEQRFADFSIAVGEAIWNEEQIPVRMPKIIEVFLALLDEVMGRRLPEIASGAAIMYTLWQVSVSTSLQEVRVRGAETGDDGSRVALVLGFGGSHCDELEGQATFYSKKGFTVISTSRVAWPLNLAEKQLVMMARELRSALTSETHFVLHTCSQHGLIYATMILEYWMNGTIPFDGLPPVAEVLKAWVIDCAAPSRTNPETKELDYPTDLEIAKQIVSESLAEEAVKRERDEDDEDEEDLGPEADSPMTKSQIKFYKSVMIGSTGAMSKKWGLKSVEEMVPKNKEIAKAFNVAARMIVVGAPWVEEYQGTTRSLMSKVDSFLALQMRDWELPPLPRLFLYSQADMLITAEMVENYIRHTKKYRPEAKVFTKKLLQSAHCRLWDTEFEACEDATAKFLEAVSVPLS